MQGWGPVQFSLGVRRVQFKSFAVDLVRVPSSGSESVIDLSYSCRVPQCIQSLGLSGTFYKMDMLVLFAVLYDHTPFTN